MARPGSGISSNAKSTYLRFFPAVKLVFVLIGFAVVVYGTSKGEDQDFWSFDPWHLIVFILLSQLSYLVLAVRMKYCLQCFAMTISLKDSIVIYFQSMFYYFFVPMNVGLEVSRYVKVKKVSKVESSPVLALSLAVDRLLGLGSALVMTVALLPFIDITGRWQLGEISGYWYLIAAVPLLALPFLWRRWAGFRGFLFEAIGHVRRSFWALVALFICSLFMNFLMGLALHHGALAVGISLGVLLAVFSLCASMLALLLPISIAGFSGAELASVAIFQLLGFSFSESVAIAFLGYLLRLLPAAQGGLVELFESIMEFRRNRQAKE